MEELVWIYIIGAALLAAAFVYVIMRGKLAVLQEKVTSSSQQADLLRRELDQERELVSLSEQRFQHAKEEIIKWQAEYRGMQERYQTEVADTKQKETKFENLANRVLEIQKESFDHHNRKSITQLIQPLRQQIEHFEKKVERTNQEAVSRHASLKEQIRILSENNDQVSKEANNLTKALKGDNKVQGNWGELILESVLDRSGLVKDREYFVQITKRNEEGRMVRPDVIIALPDGKKLVIDSKVSLTAYDALVGAVESEDQSRYAKAHAQSLRNHVVGLSAKNYHDLYDIGSPDFVMMFVPIDTAFSSALQLDDQLYQFAFDKNIVIVTPSTLLATLKTVETLWRNDKQHRNAIEIAKEAGNMFDKFVSFVEDMNKLKSQMQTASNTFDQAMNKLETGKGNLVRRAERVKSLGAKASKHLPEVNKKNLFE